MRKNVFLVALSLVIVAIVVGAGATAWKVKVAFDEAREVHAMVMDILDAPNKTMWQWEEWTPDQFFSDPQMLLVCDAISSKDMEVLQEAVRGVDDLNKQGASGVTLLHWALFDENLEAFEFLLEQGADPDLKLTGFIVRKRDRPLVTGDSILFTALQVRKRAFFLAALDYTNDVNQLNRSGESLLLFATGPKVLCDPATVRRLAEKGIDLNRTDEYGSTAADRALTWFRPGTCLEILKAGGDPTIQDERGHDIASQINRLIKKAEENPDRHTHLSKEHYELQAWLQSHYGEATSNADTISAGYKAKTL